MSSQNTSQRTAASEEDVEATQSMTPVSDSEPATTGNGKSSPEKTSAAPAEPAGTDSVSEEPQSREQTKQPAAPAEQLAEPAEQTSSPMKEGAVKAAATALAAARNAARKVQSASSSASASGRTADASAPSSGATGTPGATPPPPPAPDSADRSAPRPEMHYSVGGVHGTAQQPQTGAQPVAATEAGVRRVRLSVSRVDPWSVMKLAFLLSFAVGIMMVVATAVAWYMLNSMGTFGTIQEFLVETLGNQAIDITQFVAFERVISLSMLVALVNMVLMTALATIMAILYNITAALVGGVHVALTDE